MSTFTVQLELGDLLGTRFLAVPDAVVDTGAALPAVPRALLASLGIQPTRRIPFILADGRIVESDAGQARIRVQGREEVMPVVFAEDGEPVLLGAWALEVLFLAVDPVNETLVPVPGLRVSRS